MIDNCFEKLFVVAGWALEDKKKRKKTVTEMNLTRIEHSSINTINNLFKRRYSKADTVNELFAGIFICENKIQINLLFNKFLHEVYTFQWINKITAVYTPQKHILL